MEWIFESPDDIIIVQTTEDGTNIEETKTKVKYLKYVPFFDIIFTAMSSFQQVQGKPPHTGTEHKSEEGFSIIDTLTVSYCRKWWLEEYLKYMEYMYPLLAERDEKIKRVTDEIKEKHAELRRELYSKSDFGIYSKPVKYDPEVEKKEIEKAVDKIKVEFEDNQPEYNFDEILRKVYAEGNDHEDGCNEVKLFIEFVSSMDNGKLEMGIDDDKKII